MTDRLDMPTETQPLEIDPTRSNVPGSDPGRAERRFALAIWKASYGQPAAAQALFEEAVALDPPNTSFRMAYAAFLFDRKQWAVGRQQLWQAVEDNAEFARRWLDAELRNTPGKASLLYSRALALAQVHDPGAARAALDELLTIDPDHGPALADRAALLAAMGERDLADRDYRSALNLDPQNVAWLAARALLLEGMGRYEESLELLEKALSIEPDNTACMQQQQKLHKTANREIDARKYAALAQWKLEAEANEGEAASLAGQALLLDERCALAHHIQAEILIRRCFLMQARQHLQRAAALEPGDQTHRTALEALEVSIEGSRPKVSGLVAQAEATTNRQLARALLDQALSIVRDDPDALVAYARLLWSDQPAEAEKHIHTALEASPQHFGAVKMVALLLHQEGRAGEAEAQIAAALATQPKDGQLAELYADLLMQSGRYQEAAACLLTALEGQPFDGKLNGHLAVVWAKMGQSTDALARFEAALRTEPGSTFLHREYAELLRSLHRHSAAEEHYRRGLELDPDDPKLHRGYAALLATVQRYDQAREHIARAQALIPGDAEIAAEAQAIESQVERFAQVEEDVAYAAWLGRQPNGASVRRARQTFEDLIRLHPSSLIVLKEYAVFLHKHQNLALAKELLRRALDIAPGDVEMKQRLADIAEMEQRLADIAETERTLPTPPVVSTVPSSPLVREPSAVEPPPTSPWGRFVRGIKEFFQGPTR